VLDEGWQDDRLREATAVTLTPWLRSESGKFGSAGRESSPTAHVPRPTLPYATLAPLYDWLLGDRFFSSLRHTFEWVVRRYRIRFASAADVGCGTGTFVHYLRERGVPVVYGVDRSPEMLRMAIAKNRGNGARFLRQDLTRLALPESVDLVTCHFDSLNYVLSTSDLLRAFRRVRSNLHPLGHLVFDMLTDQPPMMHQGRRIERFSVAGITVVRITHWDPRRYIQTAVLTLTYARTGYRSREIHVQRRYPIASVVRLLAGAGLVVGGVHDFGTSGPVSPWTSRALYVAGIARGRGIRGNLRADL
jgi:SAM-dependent methyltransferase